MRTFLTFTTGIHIPDTGTQFTRTCAVNSRPADFSKSMILRITRSTDNISKPQESAVGLKADETGPGHHQGSVRPQGLMRFVSGCQSPSHDLT